MAVDIAKTANAARAKDSRLAEIANRQSAILKIVKELSIDEAKKKKRTELEDFKKLELQVEKLTKVLERSKTRAFAQGGFESDQSDPETEDEIESAKEESWKRESAAVVECVGKKVAEEILSYHVEFKQLQAEQLEILTTYRAGQVSFPPSIDYDNAESNYVQIADLSSENKSLREQLNKAHLMSEAQAFKIAELENELQHTDKKAQLQGNELAKVRTMLTTHVLEKENLRDSLGNAHLEIGNLNKKVASMKELYEVGVIARRGRFQREKSISIEGKWVEIPGRGKPFIWHILDRNRVVHHGFIQSDMDLYDYLVANNMSESDKAEFLVDFKHSYGLALDKVGPSALLHQILNFHSTMYSCYYNTDYTPNNGATTKGNDRKFEVLFNDCLLVWEGIVAKTLGDLRAAAEEFNDLHKIKQKRDSMKCLVEETTEQLRKKSHKRRL